MRIKPIVVRSFVIMTLLLVMTSWLWGFAPMQEEISGVAAHFTSTGSVLYGAVNPGANLFTTIYRLVWLNQSDTQGKFVLGGSYTLESGETLDSDLVVLGGSANIQENAAVSGDVVILGGSLQLSGAIAGDVVVLGGLADLADTANVEGDVTTISGNLRQQPGAVIEGTINENFTGPLPLPFSTTPAPSNGANSLPSALAASGSWIWNGIFFLFRSFMWAVLAIVAVLFLPKNTERVCNALVSSPAASAGLGLLTLPVAVTALVITTITIIGIPLAFFMALVMVTAWAYGLVAVGTETGKRLARALNQSWALPVTAAVGAFLVSMLINGFNQVVPCIGWLAPVLVGAAGLGAVVLTLFGSRAYPQEITR